MGFFMSPVKLLNVITSSASINKEIQSHPVSWYFSKEGEETYKNAKKTADKVEFFYKYLRQAKGDGYESANEFLQSIAYIMAVAMDGTSKPYGSWPGIIDKKVNPIINFAINHTVASLSTIMKVAKDNDIDVLSLKHYQEQNTIASALAAVRETKDIELFMPTTANAYENLTKQENDPELFFIERCIIFTFGNDYYDAEEGLGPYCFGLLEETDNYE